MKRSIQIGDALWKWLSRILFVSTLKMVFMFSCVPLWFPRWVTLQEIMGSDFSGKPAVSVLTIKHWGIFLSIQIFSFHHIPVKIKTGSLNGGHRSSLSSHCQFDWIFQRLWGWHYNFFRGKNLANPELTLQGTDWLS